MPAKMKWTPELDEKLRKHQQNSNYLLARMLGLDAKTIARRRVELRLKYAGHQCSGGNQPGASVAHAEELLGSAA